MNPVLSEVSPVRRIVLKRDACRCTGCGREILELPFTFWCRLEDPGPLYGSPAAWLILCGSCALLGERQKEGRGYRLREDDDPALIPVMVFSEGGSGVTAWLTEAGGYVYEAPAQGSDAA